MSRILFAGFLSIFFVLSLFWGSTAFALKKKGVVKGAYVGCLTESFLHEFINYSSEKDYDGMNALLGKYCIAIKGSKYSVIEIGFGIVKVRLYAAGKSIVLWTVPDALQ